MKIFAPVSIGNFSVGFDLLGLAIAPINGEMLGDVISVVPADSYDLNCSGPYASVLPMDKSSNLVTLAYKLFMQKMASKGLPTTAVSLHLEKRLPVGSGLGSSASSSVAALYGLNKFFGDALSIDDLLLMAGTLEGKVSGSVHYDNVAPCLLGGLQLMTGVTAYPCVSVPFFESWQLVVSYPAIEVSTKLAREMLPKQLDLATGIQFAQNLSVFVHALHNEDETLAASVLFDVIAESTRKKLIPQFDGYRDYAKSMGAIAFGISGSGPTVFALTNNHEISTKIQNYALNNFCGDAGFSYICKVDNFGVRQVEDIMQE
ncbi:Homoserine kinase [hydrothermal vent metagenome]|uniref:Homoserine kinase n=1 Tax=hydrothermal vent metagenome TaxID=652676 RepID=A0A3B0VE50_9ZZZZ